MSRDKPSKPDGEAVRRWKSAVRKAKGELHSAINRPHSKDYFEAIRAKVDELEEIDRQLGIPHFPRDELDVPFWDRMLITWEQYSEPLAIALFLIIFIAGILVGSVL